MSSIPNDRGVAPEAARFEAMQSEAGLALRFFGALEVASIAPLWNDVLRAMRQTPGRALVLDLAGVSLCDTAGATMLLLAERIHGGTATISGADARVAAVIALVRPATAPPPPRAAGPAPSWREVLIASLSTCTSALTTLGAVVVATIRLPTRRRMFRTGDLLRATDAAGVQAIPLVLLLGVLIGLILAFQSLVPMRRFGADIYVANLVALGLVRELGPLLTAVVLAGRSASAFAAEIGTMKVNQELDALATMGIDAMTMLVLPRLLAATLMMPVLTANGIPPITIANQVAYQVVPLDLYGGLFKAALFGIAVATIGCQAGLATGVGPRAAGLSATSAVVGGIVAVVTLDGVLAVLFYRLGI